MTRRMYEVQVKHLVDVGQPWETLPQHTFTGTARQIHAHAVQIATSPDVFEVRYNRAGHVQGHYVAGQKGRYA